jgi:hypothetical protein
METLPEGSRVVGGICGATAEGLASPLHPPLNGHMVIRAHGVTVAALEDSLSPRIAGWWRVPAARGAGRVVRAWETTRERRYL